MNTNLPSALLKTPAGGVATLCAWHPRADVLIAEFWAWDRGLSTSHGICPCCARAMTAATAQPKKES